MTDKEPKPHHWLVIPWLVKRGRPASWTADEVRGYSSLEEARTAAEAVAREYPYAAVTVRMVALAQRPERPVEIEWREFDDPIDDPRD